MTVSEYRIDLGGNVSLETTSGNGTYNLADVAILQRNAQNNISGITDWSGNTLSTLGGPVRVVCSTVDQIIAANTAAVANSVHTVIELVPGQTYNVPVGTTVTIDSAWVEVEGNYSILSCAAWGATTGIMLHVYGGNSGIHDYTKYSRGKRTLRNLMLLNDPTKYFGTDNGPDLLKFDVPEATGLWPYSNRCYIDQVICVGGRRNVIFGSDSYFIKFRGCEFVRAYQCFDTTAVAFDFAEQIEFETCLFAENGVVWGPSAKGQIYNVRGGSIDYNRRICNTSNGTRVNFHNKVHIEWSYGANNGETNEPFYMSSADGYIGGSVAMIYTGGTDPKYTSIAATTNNTNQMNFEIMSGTNLKRISNRKSLDAFHRNIGAINSQVSVKIWAPQSKAADIPAMATVSESNGSYGMIRGGISSPMAGLGHIIGKSGTANAVVERTATTNSVNRKTVSSEAGSGAQPMLEFSNSAPGTAAKYYICFPKYERGRKVSWSFFVNTFAVTSGSFTIKERRNGPAAVLADGTNVTFANPSDGVNYHGTTVTLTSANSANADDWNRYDASDTAGTAAGGMITQVRHDMTFMDVVELDLTNCTGFVYLSFIGCGPIGAQL